ncbi:MAG: NAD(P)-binding protein, partial [Pseudomonadales bacterium]
MANAFGGYHHRYCVFNFCTYILNYCFRNCILTKIAIIGAGLAGLSAAHLLKEHSDITVFEKARG